MDVVGEERDAVVVRLSRDGLRLLNNGLNEVLNGVHIPDWEFATRLGATREESRALLAEIHRLLDRAKHDSES
jgi:hypothetical protein